MHTNINEEFSIGQTFSDKETFDLVTGETIYCQNLTPIQSISIDSNSCLESVFNLINIINPTEMMIVQNTFVVPPVVAAVDTSYSDPQLLGFGKIIQLQDVDPSKADEDEAWLALAERTWRRWAAENAP